MSAQRETPRATTQPRDGSAGLAGSGAASTSGDSFPAKVPSNNAKRSRMVLRPATFAVPVPVKGRRGAGKGASLDEEESQDPPAEASQSPSEAAAAAAAASILMAKDTLLAVLSFLPPRDIVRCSAVCRAWRGAVESAPWQLWHGSLSSLTRRHGHPPQDSQEQHLLTSAPAKEGTAAGPRVAPGANGRAPLPRSSPSAPAPLQRPGSAPQAAMGGRPAGPGAREPGRNEPGQGLVSPLPAQLDAEDSRMVWRDSALLLEAGLRPTVGTVHVESLQAHVGDATCCAVQGGAVLTGGEDEMVCLWEASQQGRHERRLHLRSPSCRPILGVAMSETLLLASSGADVFVWSRERGRLLKKLGGHHQPIASLCFEDTDVAVGCFDGTVHMFDVYSGGSTQILRPHSRSATAVSCDAESSLLLSGGGDGAVVLHDYRASVHVANLLNPWLVSGWVSGVQLQAGESSALASTSKGALVRFDLRTMKMAAMLDGGGGGALVLCNGLSVPRCSPVAPRTVLACLSDGTVQVADWRTLAVSRCIPVQPSCNSQQAAVDVSSIPGRQGKHKATSKKGGTQEQTRSAWRGGGGRSAPRSMQPQGSAGPLAAAVPAFGGSHSPSRLSAVCATWGGFVGTHCGGSVSFVQFHL